MTQNQSAEEANALVRGEFYTDGKTFVMRLADTPVSGIGASADAAFAELTRAQGAAADLPGKIQALAKEQHGEAARAALIRMIMAALIAFGAVGGALAGAAALAPRVIGSVAEVAVKKLGADESVSRLAARFGCAPAETAEAPEGGGAKPEAAP